MALRLTIRAKMLIAFVSLAVLPLLLLGWLGYVRSGQIVQKRITTELQIEVETGADTLETFLAGVSRDVTSLARFLGRRLSPRMNESQWQMVEDEFLQTIRNVPAYYQVRFISTEGMETLRINKVGDLLQKVPKDKLQYKGDRYYVKEAMSLPAEQVYLSHLDYNQEFGRIEEPRRLVVRVATTVYSRGELRGLVIINVFGEDLLAALVPLQALPGSRVALLDEQQRFVEMNQVGGRPDFRTGPTRDLETDLGLKLNFDQEPSSPVGRHQAMVSSARIEVGFEHAWRLLKIYPRELFEADLQSLLRTTAYTALPLALLAMVLAILAARSFSRPVLHLSTLAETIAGGDYSCRATVASHDELGQLASSLNIMADSLETSREQLIDMNLGLQFEVNRKVEELKRSEAAAGEVAREMQGLEKQLLAADRLAALGMLSATVAHEIGNPLAGLKTRLQLMQRKTGDDVALAADLERMLQLVDRLGKVLEQLTGYLSPKQELQLQPVDLARVLRDLVFILREEAERRGVAFVLDLPEQAAPVRSSGQQLHQIFMNLILNALQAVEAGGAVRVSARLISSGVEVQVADSGRGFPLQDRERLFEPLVTTRSEGTGLGLAIVKRLVDELRGEITLENRAAGGALVRVFFARGDEL